MSDYDEMEEELLQEIGDLKEEIKNLQAINFSLQEENERLRQKLDLMIQARQR